MSDGKPSAGGGGQRKQGLQLQTQAALPSQGTVWKQVCSRLLMLECRTFSHALWCQLFRVIVLSIRRGDTAISLQPLIVSPKNNRKLLSILLHDLLKLDFERGIRNRMQRQGSKRESAATCKVISVGLGAGT